MSGFHHLTKQDIKGDLARPVWLVQSDKDIGGAAYIQRLFMKRWMLQV
jgi:hypothetical protein